MRIRFKVSKMQAASGLLFRKKTDKIFTRTEAATLFCRGEAKIGTL